MKKMLNLILLILSHIGVFAQFDGTPFYFCTLSGEQYNPGTHGDSHLVQDKWVVTVDDYTQSERTFIQESFEEYYPNHTILEESTPTYNCHGYSFGIFQGTVPCKITWFDEFCNGAFVEITDKDNIIYGDIAVIRYKVKEGYDPGSIHSSVVVNKDTLMSKWGDGPLTKHHKYDLVDEIYNFDDSTKGVYTYYRRVANTAVNGPAPFKGNGSYVFAPNVQPVPASCFWSIEPAEMFQQTSDLGTTASPVYVSNPSHLSPQGVITFEFSYDCDNHYTAKKEIELEIPTSTLSGVKTSDGFIVGDNSVVTVTGEISMSEGSKIIVKPGGRLVIDDGVLTSACQESKWQGIQVWGIDSLHQHLSNGKYLQGVLELKNGATIENAVCAVDLWNPLDEHSEGGIVWAENATFRNNAKAIRALNYSNYTPNSGLESQNASWFRNCSFIIDSDYIGNNTFYNHVELNNVDGIKFYACSFSADNSASQLASSISAIYASSAGFTVTSECSSPGFPCPEDNLIYSNFNGFDNAIHVTNNGGSVRTFSVSGSEFWNNERGIYATNTGYATIINNKFYIGSKTLNNYGIYIENVMNFCIEENYFTATKKANSYGLVVVNSPSYNEIYLNHFYNLHYGNIAGGVNVSATDSNIGLAYICNTNEGNTNDFGVMQYNRQAYIKLYQGSSTIAAANTFSATNYHFYNEGNFLIKYFYNGGANRPTRVLRVSSVAAAKNHECESHYDVVVGGGGGSGGGMMSAEKTDSLKNKYENSFSSFNRLNSLNTYKIEKDSAQRIQQESQMSMLQRECLLTAGDIVRTNLNKEERDFNELREWIGKSNDISSARMIIASYIQQKDFVNAIALAKKMPATYDLQGEELNEFYDYLDIIRLHESLSETNRTTLQLSDYETALLEDIAENGTGASKAMAEAILAENRGLPTIVISACPTIPNFATAVRGTDESEMTSDTAFKVELSPNPATTNVEVSYTLPENETNATLVMTNTLGVNVMTVHLDGNNGKTTLSLEELPSGIYFYTIRCGENVKSGKLVKRI